MNRLKLFAVIILSFFLTIGCTSVRDAETQKAGQEERSRLVNQIAEAKADQASAGRQLETAFEAFQRMRGANNPDLQHAYDRLNSELQKAQDRANTLNANIKSIDQVGSALFDEWQAEISQTIDPQIKSRSSLLLRDARLTEAAYLISLRATQAKMQPILKTLEQESVFLKHNLNAELVGTLKPIATRLNGDVADLVRGIQGSRSEADRLISALTSSAT